MRRDGGSMLGRALWTRTMGYRVGGHIRIARLEHSGQGSWIEAPTLGNLAAVHRCASAKLPEATAV
eukprot:7794795-Pyramimonas_sp.AAC.1